MQLALIRDVSPTIGACQLTYLTREPIAYATAVRQHRAYSRALRELGLTVVSLPAEPHLPDAVFVEDAALVLDELAVLGATGVPSRRPEVASLERFLRRHRPIRQLPPGSTFEGGDVVRLGRRLYVGESRRTNRAAIRALATLVEPAGYDVRPVRVSGCLHLSTGASAIGRDTIPLNPQWVDARAFAGCDTLPVPRDEPWAANTLAVNGTVVMPARCPRTRARLERHGLSVTPIDISEFAKAEAGVTCLTNIMTVQSACAGRA